MLTRRLFWPVLLAAAWIVGCGRQTGNVGGMTLDELPPLTAEDAAKIQEEDARIYEEEGRPAMARRPRPTR